jgi:hypothetical protein
MVVPLVITPIHAAVAVLVAKGSQFCDMSYDHLVTRPVSYYRPWVLEYCALIDGRIINLPSLVFLFLRVDSYAFVQHFDHHLDICPDAVLNTSREHTAPKLCQSLCVVRRGHPRHQTD